MKSVVSGISTIPNSVDDGVMTTVKGQTTGWEIRAAREVCRLIRWLPFAMAVKSSYFH